MMDYRENPDQVAANQEQAQRTKTRLNDCLTTITQALAGVNADEELLVQQFSDAPDLIEDFSRYVNDDEDELNRIITAFRDIAADLDETLDSQYEYEAYFTQRVNESENLPSYEG